MDANPYTSPVETARIDAVTRPQGEEWWRWYLYLHVVVVVLTGLASWLEQSR